MSLGIFPRLFITSYYTVSVTRVIFLQNNRRQFLSTHTSLKYCKWTFSVHMNSFHMQAETMWGFTCNNKTVGALSRRSVSLAISQPECQLSDPHMCGVRNSDLPGDDKSTSPNI